jgi:hypothetical protein
MIAPWRRVLSRAGAHSSRCAATSLGAFVGNTPRTSVTPRILCARSFAATASPSASRLATDAGLKGGHTRPGATGASAVCRTERGGRSRTPHTRACPERSEWMRGYECGRSFPHRRSSSTSSPRVSRTCTATGTRDRLRGVIPSAPPARRPPPCGGARCPARLRRRGRGHPPSRHSAPAHSGHAASAAGRQRRARHWSTGS